jgi:hypothetical protein
VGYNCNVLADTKMPSDPIQGNNIFKFTNSPYLVSLQGDDRDKFNIKHSLRVLYMVAILFFLVGTHFKDLKIHCSKTKVGVQISVVLKLGVGQLDTDHVILTEGLIRHGSCKYGGNL